MKALLTALLLLCPAGVSASAGLHVAGALGPGLKLLRLFVVLLAGCFVVALPTIVSCRRFSAGRSGREFWRRHVYPACPGWMKWTFRALMAYLAAWVVAGGVLAAVDPAGAERWVAMVFTASFMALYFGCGVLLCFRLGREP